MDVNDMLSFSRLFGYITDFKSHLLAMHAGGLAAAADTIAQKLGYSMEERKLIRIASNLSNVKSLSIPSEMVGMEKGVLFYSNSNSKESFRAVESVKNMGVVGELIEFSRGLNAGQVPDIRVNDLSPGAQIVLLSDIFTSLVESGEERVELGREGVELNFDQLIEINGIDRDLVAILRENYHEILGRVIEARKKADYRYKSFLSKVKEEKPVPSPLEEEEFFIF